MDSLSFQSGLNIYTFAKFGILVQKWPYVYWYSYYNISIPWIKLPICFFQDVCLNLFVWMCMFELVWKCLWSECLFMCLNTCVLWIYLFVASLLTLLWNMDLVLTFDALMSTLINFCSFLAVIINDFKQMGLNFQSGHGHVHIQVWCLFLVLFILNFVLKLGPYAWCVQ
jgi:hypothetical protein